MVAGIVTPYASFYLEVHAFVYFGGGGDRDTIWIILLEGFHAFVYFGCGGDRDTICIILLEGFQVFVSNDVVFMVAEGWGGGGYDALFKMYPLYPCTIMMPRMVDYLSISSQK